jgi:MinD superfamily P-loop ATPase
MNQENKQLTIAVASGKGGTGKTTIATNLAMTMTEDAERTVYLDCDVEEPNGHIFLNPEWDRVSDVTVPIPEVDQSACIHCGKCGQICQYSAIADMNTQVLTFPDLCHSCGGCTLVCPVGAIQDKLLAIGVLSEGHTGLLPVIQGELKIGHPVSPPVIKAVKAAAPKGIYHIIDSPPGTSCPVIESVSGADYVVLVTEPTPFGLFDLKLAVDMLYMRKQAFGVVINRAEEGNRLVHEFCEQKQIPILIELEDDRRIAEAYSRGELAIQHFPELKNRFRELLKKIQRRLQA